MAGTGLAGREGGLGFCCPASPPVQRQELYSFTNYSYNTLNLSNPRENMHIMSDKCLGIGKELLHWFWYRYNMDSMRNCIFLLQEV